MLEILTVVGIIVVLIGLTIVGARRIMNSGRESSTKVTLKNLQGMMGELEALGPLKAPGTWEWTSTVNITTSNPNNLDFWKVPYRTSPTVDGEPLPTVSVADGSTDRYGSPAVINTQIVMARLLAITNNANAMGKMPARDQYQPHAAAVKANATAAATKIIGYVPNADRYPLLLDAWNNPIIYVPASGLGKTGATVASDGTVPAGALKNSGQATGDATLIKTSPDGKGFFASAGPDGNFQTGDDNIYSFEQ